MTPDSPMNALRRDTAEPSCAARALARRQMLQEAASAARHTKMTATFSAVSGSRVPRSQESGTSAVPAIRCTA